MDNINTLIKKHLADKAVGSGLKRSKKCPSEADLTAYLHGTISEQKSEKISQHISQCLFCLEAIEQTSRQDMSIREPGPPRQVIERAKAIAKTQGSGGFYRLKKHLWLIGAVIAFGLSFILSKYFFQFLILTLILGIKWALDTANTRTLIMVNDAWHKHRNKDDQEKPAKKPSL
ncbi:MAG: hypothetical protein U9Q08_01830 [Candidatus Omnitrophota bacterium]|nr:hypothetical protein [Candidatus Omnitrophota bacterium]